MESHESTHRKRSGFFVKWYIAFRVVSYQTQSYTIRTLGIWGMCPMGSFCDIFTSL